MPPLSLYFNTIADKKNQFFFNKKGYVGNDIVIGQYKFTDIKKNIAIFSVHETRNSHSGQYNVNTNLFRKYFYNLAAINEVIITDLGELKNGNTINDTYCAINEVVTWLISENVLPVIIGGSHDNTLALKNVVNKKEQQQITIIDSEINLTDQIDINSKSFINQLITSPQKIDINVLGYQNYLVPKYVTELALKNNIDIIRLANLRASYSEIEPVLRDTDILSFDLSAIKSQDCPQNNHNPNGLNADEACQITNIAGLCDKIKVFSIFELLPNIDLSSHLTAQLTWNFINGVAQRKNDYPIGSLDNYKKIYVKNDKNKTDIVFYKNEQNNRYWFEIPYQNNNPVIVSCSETDYYQMCKNQIPDRLLKALKKL